ncbi:putative HIT finger domain protein [Aspergillus saccharolyticus JOP 1030-1]|uniref:HIT-type domain-containing protein n=1 Tax=Aspergillus saccharolyticus JOP 1030-1 TaxID=1450539 RepID=A0A318ZRF8_9EURO|nr:hypothetical protein BP01DRAFT_415012 [Aspergillus saccharolyticus JOP 1030-1]PYH46540.1 hypothetical protein BP01DRAFT_415012 [Aspergillus saccharolyticus JOP 1030-1]
MYHVELLPGSTTHATPGWTYVPDRGFDPAKAAITPTIGRKRGIRDPGRTDLSSRQTNAIVRHLAELDRENHRDVHIPVPVRQKEPAAPRGTRTKTTSNVRRILQSQKTFRNYLDDEEAALASASTNQTNTTTTTTTTTANPLNRIAKPASTAKQTGTTTGPSSRASTAQPTPSAAPESTSPSAAAATTTPETGEAAAIAEEESKPNTTTLIRSEHDSNPLLRSYLPTAPSERIMQALLAEPPLTYNASRAGPPLAPRRSPRYFCCMCGYWGKIRCKNCHARTCGLTCYKVHEDSRCGAFF